MEGKWQADNLGLDLAPRPPGWAEKQSFLRCCTNKSQYHGAYMPTHISTMEAVVTVIEGEAVIEMAGKDHALRASDTLVIPAGEPHSLVMKAKTTS